VTSRIDLIKKSSVPSILIKKDPARQGNDVACENIRGRSGIPFLEGCCRRKSMKYKIQAHNLPQIFLPNFIVAVLYASFLGLQFCCSVALALQ
jgi:hypothetical protein